MVDAFQIGAMGTDTLTGRVCIVISCLSAALAGVTGRCFLRADANYQVTAGKTLYITAYQITTAAALAHPVEIRYADDAALTTNPVTMLPSLPVLAPTTGSPIFPVGGTTAAPATKYVGIFNPNAASTTQAVSVTVIGYEA
jgi:hypothetical protein